MNNYKNFTQKYRPKSFKELKGHNILKKSLSNSFIEGKIYHSYIFTGSSGVGKTTVARILAKTLNCPNSTSEENILLPCNICKNCNSIAKSNHPDVFEFDAASKTGVDDIRDIISNTEFLPIAAKYKVFIVDEVHMLSKNAFNALLKIIEEPPEYVIFVFATTEINKIPDTIVSRCNIYELEKLTYTQTKELILDIVEQEKIEIEDQALEILSSKSNGSGRLAVIYLEQIANFQNTNKILAKDVTTVMGIESTSTLIKLLNLIEQKNSKEAIELVKTIYIKSNSINIFLSSLSDFIAEIIKFKMIKEYNNILYKDYQTEITALSQKITNEKLSILWQIFSQSLNELEKSHNILLFLEMNIIKSIFSISLPEISNTQPLKDQDTKTSYIENYLSENNIIINFIKFVHSRKEFEIYYSLLNNMEFSLEGNILHISTNLDLYQKSSYEAMNENSKLTEIKDLFKKFNQSSQLQINFIKKNNIENLKSKIIQEIFHKDENFQLLKKEFDDVEISDIILEKN
ncbi:MAG: DNA polymerase III subunit gamma/tau [Rickettsia sp.]|nr:DNA polymerase III subunit gamma/tau [Rickettsia sp.]